MDFDKSAAEIFLEQATKKLRGLVSEALPGRAVRHRRGDHVIFVDNEPVVKLESPSYRALAFRWSSGDRTASFLRDSTVPEDLRSDFRDKVARATWI